MVREENAPLVVVMGVSGSGKTTVGQSLAQLLHVPFAEADDLHSPENVAKMRAGKALDDEDRRPWLDAIAAWLLKHDSGGGVITCSALRRSYRERLASASSRVFFVHLHGPAELIAERMAARRGHFMPVELLQSQLDALEPLTAEERGAVVPITGTAEEITHLALTAVRDH
ncbi:gluconokinase [Streptomyces sp. ALI-76-A]|jgi:gluconokinase|uniref:gluconokinase n=1 Tax=Streptomyces sp. ALI-76-A TaxID=3025736 RepID=UPI00256EB641|nr:gluconokinase [Streptomyces sp. ALI-76-A]MDL5205894.1 gluconokinase [Streptomyces sp. ALI-76-A]